MSWEKGFADLCKKTHTEQAIWWLNGFWHEGAEAEQENIWKFAHNFIEIESGQKVLYGSKKRKGIEEKCDLDEMQAHRFLEEIGETLTVKELRARLKKLDIDSNNRLALSEYLVSKYQKDPAALVDSNQGGVPPEVMEAAQKEADKASELLNSAIEASDEAKATATAATKASVEAGKALALAEKSAQEAKDALEKSNKAAEEAAAAQATAEQQAAEAAEATKLQEEVLEKANAVKAEVKAGAEALEAQEKAYNDKIAKLEAKANDSSLSTVKRGSFVAKLAALRSEDPLPLRKAKITQNAALKKQKKITKKVKKQTEATRKKQEEADAAAAAAKKSREEADVAAADSAQAKQEADDAADASAKAKQEADDAKHTAEEAEAKAAEAVDAAQAAFTVCSQTLEELKNDDSPPNGAIWWMGRIMTEKEKYMPKRKKKKK